uniref:Putative ovule protein n=1 Tax=Solanum chacoense TaxID=4108 RepID=A0A0V0I6M8_SOLCH
MTAQSWPKLTDFPLLAKFSDFEFFSKNDYFRFLSLFIVISNCRMLQPSLSPLNIFSSSGVIVYCPDKALQVLKNHSSIFSKFYNSQILIVTIYHHLSHHKSFFTIDANKSPLKYFNIS